MQRGADKFLGLMFFVCLGASLSAVPKGSPYRWLKVALLTVVGYGATVLLAESIGVLAVGAIGGLVWAGLKVYEWQQRREAANPEAAPPSASAIAPEQPPAPLSAPAEAAQPPAAPPPQPPTPEAARPEVASPPSRGPGWRLYLSAQVVAVAGIVLFAVPFWVVRLHDRAVVRKAMGCWTAERNVRAINEEFAARVTPLLYPEHIKRPCWTADGCGSLYLGNLKKLGIPLPGSERIEQCRMAAVPMYYYGDVWRDYSDKAAMSCRGTDRQLVECQLGYFLGLQEVAPYDLWDRASEVDDGKWEWGSTSGFSPVEIVIELYPTQAALSVGLLLLPGLLYGLRRWALWIAGKGRTA